ncbi:MAG: 7-cyano-7-deazaguanine synthase QueC [Armatimonadetes bacterium]|nr:7-cyano-7-deazaguanine synthase QueC [Armatimonadota bacterium]
MKRAVVLLSGGLDSSTAAAIARDRGYDLYALTFDYGQRHRREIEAAMNVGRALGVRDHVVISFDLRKWGGSALTDDIDVPTGRDVTEMAADIPVTYVPARNTIFLSFALGYAETIGADTIFIGANQVDYSGYPDCREEYLRAFETMANLATRAGVEGTIRFKTEAPLIDMTKAEIIKAGTALGLDYGLTWSCYQGGERPCGACDSCRLRSAAFKAAGVRDPVWH